MGAQSLGYSRRSARGCIGRRFPQCPPAWRGRLPYLPLPSIPSPSSLSPPRFPFYPLSPSLPSPSSSGRVRIVILTSWCSTTLKGETLDLIPDTILVFNFFILRCLFPKLEMIFLYLTLFYFILFHLLFYFFVFFLFIFFSFCFIISFTFVYSILFYYIISVL